MKRRTALKRLALSAALAVGGLTVGAPAFAQNTIKVGVLHSLSGTMAISETVLKDVTLMAIDEINAKGGVLGKKLELDIGDDAGVSTVVGWVCPRCGHRPLTLEPMGIWD